MYQDNIISNLLPESTPDLSISALPTSLPNTNLEDFSPITPHLTSLEIRPSTLKLVDQIRKDNPASGETDKFLDFEKKILGGTGITMNDYISPSAGISLSGVDVDTDLVRKQLNNGDAVARFNSFTPLIDNEDSQALRQGFLEQTLNGIGKFVGKTALNVIDGTIGTTVGLVNGISEGSMSAIYNNDFSKFIDDLNVRMDLQLPNYYTQEQKNMDFLRSTLTTNFWANDVLGGLSFMVGAIGSEAIWAGLTGGTSLASAPARVLAKAGARGLLKTVGKSAGQNFHKNTLKAFNKYKRTIPIGKVGQGASTLRFLYTSAGFEAGVEARHSLNGSLENFTAAHERVNGRKPNAAEYSLFMEDAVDSANKVFAANVGLVGASNIAQFGALFGIGTGLTKSLTRSVGKTFGVGITKTLDDTGKIVYEQLKPTKFKRRLGKTLSILSAPVVEGVVEEGGQGVISKTSEKWLAARYNPDALQENYGVIQAATKGFEDTYGTKEGRKEVGLGMLIGGFGARGTRALSGQSVLGTSFQDSIDRNVEIAEGLNKVSAQMNAAQKSLLGRLVGTNQFNTFIKSAKENTDKGDIFQASLDFDAAQYSKMLLEKEAGMLSESEMDFEKVIKETPSERLAEEFGISAEQAIQYKSAMIDNYKNNVKLFKESTQIAESLAPRDFKIKDVGKDYTQELGLNIFLGVKSGRRAKDLADSIDELIGTDGAGSALRLYSNLSKKAKRRVERMSVLEKEVSGLEAQLATLNQSFDSTNLNADKRKEENKSVADAFEARESDRQKLVTEIQNKRAELDTVKAKLDDRFYKSNFSFGGRFNIFNDSVESGSYVTDADITASIAELEKLDRFRELLREENPQVANQLDSLLEDYRKNTRAFRDFNLVFEQMADSRFAANSYKGASRLFKNIGPSFTSSTSEESQLDVNTKALANFLEANKDNLDESDVFTVKVLHRLSTGFKINTGVLTEVRETSEPISQQDYESFLADGVVPEAILDNIAEKDAAGQELSEREKEIKSAKNEEIEARVITIKEERGDRLEAVVEKAEETEIVNFDETTFLGKLQNLVQDIKNSKTFLRKFDVAGISKEQKPTDKDYKRYETLIKDKQKNRLTPQKVQELDELREKINTWGRLEGTSLPDNTRLSDLIEQIIELQSGTQSPAANSMSVTDLNDIIEGLEFIAAEKNQNYDFLQSYDKAIFSVDEHGEYAIANINVSGILNIIAETLPFTLRRGTKELLSPTNGWDLKNVKKSDRFTLKFDNNGVEDKIVLKINSKGNVVVSERSKNKLNSFTPLQIGMSNEVSRKYQPVLRKVETAQGVIWVTVPTNFKFVDDTQMAIDPIFDLKAGDTLRLEVATNDPHNKKLIDNYLKAKIPAKREEALKEIRDGLVIYVKDGGGNLVGVHKSTKSSIVSAKDPNFFKLKEIRQVAAERMFSEDVSKPQTINTGITLPVLFVYFGHPNFNIHEIDGKVAVENIEFTDDVLPKVLDIGYAENGNTFLKNNSKSVLLNPYMTRVLKDEKYENRKVPFIVFDFRGNKVAYPVTLKTIENNLVEQLDTILNSNTDANTKIISINNLVQENGLDINKLGLTFENYNEESVEQIRKALASNKIFSDVSKWLDSRTIEETLKAESIININLNDPFHSPKIRTNMKAAKGLITNGAFSEIRIQEEVTPEIKEEVTESQNKDCKKD